MSSLAVQLGLSPERSPLRDAFLGWQCRCRLMMMREGGGRPSDAVTPAVTLPGETAPMGHIITIICKGPAYSVTPELQHMAAKTNEIAKWREEALRFFSATFYQKAHEFSDILTATFPPGSPGAKRLREAGACRLDFSAFGETWRLETKIWKLSRRNPLHQATFAHNRLFNPTLHPETEILGFEPDWSAVSHERAG